MSLRAFTQYVPYQPGTTRRRGKPFTMGNGWSFMAYAIITSPSRAWSIERAFTKSDTEGSGGTSSPLNETSTAPDFTWARSKIDFTETPVHLALPTAPCFHWPPGTRGSKKLRELPEH